MVKQDFYDQLEISEVGKQYLNLVSLCKTRALIPEEGYEIHHIFPTSLGGLNVNDNKVKFTIFEHCKAHALLAQAIPCYKTLQPLTKMSCGQVKTLEDAEKVELDEIFKWSELREKALHHPKSPEHVEKIRQSKKGVKSKPEHVKSRAEKRRGTTTVTDGVVTKYVKIADLEEWLNKGWTRGIGSIRRERMSQSHRGLVGGARGKIVIKLGDKELHVRPEVLQNYLDQGWQLGRPVEFTNIGRIKITKDGRSKLVTKDSLNEYLLNGWIKVRKD